MPNKPGRQTSAATRRQIVEAALETLKSEGFAGASSRVIARAGGFNQALIFYHFGSLDGLLLSALDHTSEERLDRYREAIARATSIDELLAAVARLYAEDRERGHMTVVAQMVAGSAARPELKPALVERMEPWIALCEQALEKGLGWLGLPELVPRRDLAYAFVTFYLGVNLMAQLDKDRARTDAIFAQLEALASLLASSRIRITLDG
jgi:AcrR family transcriptional regulator